jgi:3-phenylpropionate/trans-cinnamate dioxygenase ferredoxin subunit
MNVDAGPISGLEDGQIRVVEAAGRSIGVTLSSGRFYAFENRCSHEEHTLEDGWVDDGRIECAWHGSTFDLATGAACNPPAEDPIGVYTVVEVDGALIVEVLE